jgi:fatty acid desaturase
MTGLALPPADPASRAAGAPPRYYPERIAVIAAALAGGWAALILAGNSRWQRLVAVFLAAVFTQASLLGHDAASIRALIARLRISRVLLAAG